MANSKNIHREQFANPTSPAYQQLVADITARVRSGQLAAYRAVNKELIELYWDLGRMIVERQEQNSWGNSVVEMIAKDLQKTFPGVSGFSKTNLWRMRAFHIVYAENEFLPPMVGEIGWSHNYIILEKCKDLTSLNHYPKN